jgi:hypothetical protein
MNIPQARTDVKRFFCKPHLFGERSWRATVPCTAWWHANKPEHNAVRSCDNTLHVSPLKMDLDLHLMVKNHLWWKALAFVRGDLMLHIIERCIS